MNFKHSTSELYRIKLYFTFLIGKGENLKALAPQHG